MFSIFGRKLSDGSQAPKGLHDKDAVFIAALYQKYKALLFQKAAAYTSDPYAQEDIVQEAILRLARNTAKLHTLAPAALVSYMALTVRSAALNYLKADRRDRLDALPLPDDDSEQECFPLSGAVQITLEEQMLIGHRDEELRAVIERLSERDQIVLTGKYFLELDNRELADLLGTTEGALRVALSRARNRVLKELVKEGILRES